MFWLECLKRKKVCACVCVCVCVRSPFSLGEILGAISCTCFASFLGAFKPQLEDTKRLMRGSHARYEFHFTQELISPRLLRGMWQSDLSARLPAKARCSALRGHGNVPSAGDGV